MESHAQSVEDDLIDSLSFKLRPGASYVTDRKSSQHISVREINWLKLLKWWLIRQMVG